MSDEKIQKFDVVLDVSEEREKIKKELEEKFQREKAEFEKKLAEEKKALELEKARLAVEKIISEGKITPAQKDFATALYAKDRDAFEKFVAELKPVVPLGEKASENATNTSKNKKEKEIWNYEKMKAISSKEETVAFFEKMSRGEIAIDPITVPEKERALYALPTLDQQLVSTNTGSWIIPVPLYEKMLIYDNKPNYVFVDLCKDATQADSNIIQWAVIGTMVNENAEGTLSEGTAISSGTITLSAITMTPKEFGGRLLWSRKEDLFARNLTDVRNNVIGYAIRNDMQHKLDQAAYIEMRTNGTNIWINGGTFGTGNGIFAQFNGTVGNNDFLMSGTTIRKAITMLENNNAPKFPDNYYICIANPLQLHYLKEDSNWIDCKKYADNTKLLTGEVGAYMGARFIVTTMVTGTVVRWGTSGTVTAYDAVILGPEAVGKGFAIPAEITYYDDVNNDSKRTKGLYWYALGGFKVLKTTDIGKIRTAGLV